MPVLLHEPDLVLHRLLLLSCQGVQIQLVAKGSKACHIGSRVQGSSPACLVVGRGGHVASHAADRVAVGGAVLDLQPLHRVRVVACPGLGRVVQHARVKAGAAAGTGLKEHIGELPRQPVVQVIHAQDIPVEHLSLPVCGEGGTVAFCDAPVHIPLDIGNLRL